MVTLVNPGLPPISLSDGLFDTRFNKFKIGEGYVYFKLTSAPALAGQFVQHRFRNPTGSGKTWFLTKAHVRSTIANFLGITNPVSPALAALGTAMTTATKKQGQAASVMSATFALNAAGPFTIDGGAILNQANVAFNELLGIILPVNTSCDMVFSTTNTTDTDDLVVEGYEE